jgi:phosphatidylserine/phosphatidylglycerophosphate/cardiolipin synthase-like enzyme
MKYIIIPILLTAFQVFAEPITTFEDAQENLLLKGISLAENELGQDHPFLTPAFHYLLDEKTRSRMSAGNELILLPDGKSYQKKLEMVRSAKSSIFLSVMSFECGETGKEMTEALIKAKKRGVDVRIILDKMYSKVIPIFKKCYKRLEKNGIKIVNSPFSIRLRSIAKMMHDKILVKDLKEGIIGGQNMMDINNLSTPTNYNYRDTDVWVKGPIVLDLALRNINNLKKFQKLRDIDPLIESYIFKIKEKELEFKKQGLLGKKNYPSWLKSTKGICRLVGQEPISKNYYLTTLYSILAKYSQYNMVIETPQLMKVEFDLAEKMEKEIKEAADRGVRVDFITNGDNFVESYKVLMEYARRSIFTNGGLKNLVSKLAPKMGKNTGIKFLNDTLEWAKDSNVNIWKYRKFIHSKMSSFDGIINIVGSYNFDKFSANHNFESAIVCIGNDFKKQVDRQLIFDFANSTLHNQVN